MPTGAVACRYSARLYLIREFLGLANRVSMNDEPDGSNVRTLYPTYRRVLLCRPFLVSHMDRLCNHCGTKFHPGRVALWCSKCGKLFSRTLALRTFLASIGLFFLILGSYSAFTRGHFAVFQIKEFDFPILCIGISAYCISMTAPDRFLKISFRIGSCIFFISLIFIIANAL